MGELARMTEGGRVRLVTVLGPAGMGKTRLIEHFTAGVGDDEPHRRFP
jgi:Ni2+-binding GTPase involved in maturation of urease and hydrogenase